MAWRNDENEQWRVSLFGTILIDRYSNLVGRAVENDMKTPGNSPDDSIISHSNSNDRREGEMTALSS